MLIDAIITDMQPEANLPVVGPEQKQVRNDRIGDYTLPEIQQESGIDSGAEKMEQIAELRSAASDAGLTTSTPTPVSDLSTIVDNTAPTANPIVANDDDLIEKEWVDKAKKIVENTKNDPYKREDEVGKLRIDYIKKRFGRDLGSAE